MHDTAMKNGKRFFDTYAKNKTGLKIVDVGSLAVHGALRNVAPPNNTYIGLDFADGPGVDVLIKDPYALPVEDNSVDIVVCSSVFEHSEFFWLVFNDIQRMLKPSGLLYLNVPSNGEVHRWPVDCWRFYPDSGLALQNWAQRSGYKTALLESFTGKQESDQWNDYVAVFVKDPAFLSSYPNRIQTKHSSYTNGYTVESGVFSKPTTRPEDYQVRISRWIFALKNIITGSRMS
jgi:SAM-dependent methyltransferase